jgi:hypothetical protein
MTERTSITRDEYVALIASLDLFPVGDVRQITFDLDGIRAIVVVRDENGKTMLNDIGSDVAKREVHIPVADPPAVSA